MTVEVAQTTLQNNFEYQRNRVNELANAMSTVVVTTNSNTASGNAAITGTFSANSLTAGSCRITSNTGNVVIIPPTSAETTSGEYFLGANGSWAIPKFGAFGGTVQTSGLSTQVVDRYSTANTNGAEYFIQVKNNTGVGFQASKILTLHTGNSAVNGNAFSTEYAIITSNGVLGSFSTVIFGANVELRVVPSTTNTTINFSRVDF